ncbi:hypothetical protein ACFQZ2_20010, partial [Streptomonospora algeriensis]
AYSSSPARSAALLDAVQHAAARGLQTYAGIGAALAALAAALAGAVLARTEPRATHERRPRIPS